MSESLYQRALGPSFSELHPTLQRFHSAPQQARSQGRMLVERGRGWVRNALATLMKLPPASEDTEVRLTVDVLDQRERWTRWFGEHPLHSWISLSKGLLLERSGLVTLGLQLSVIDGNLRFDSRKVWLGPLPIPALLTPRVTVTTEADERGWQIETVIEVPLLGRMARYVGRMQELTPPPT